MQNLRRSAGGAVGAPAGLLSGQLFSNEQENVLYIGTGNNGSGVSTGQAKMGGSGAFVDLSTTQTVAGVKTFSSSLSSAAGSSDTSAWAAFLDGTASPLPTNFATKISGSINLPFPAVVGISNLYTAPASITSGSTTVTLAAAPPSGVLLQGQGISYGSAFPSGTTITAVSGTTLTTSNASTKTNPAAVIGIGQPAGYTGHSQFAQKIVQAITTANNTAQESADVVNMISQTGSVFYQGTASTSTTSTGVTLSATPPSNIVLVGRLISFNSIGSSSNSLMIISASGATLTLSGNAPVAGSAVTVFIQQPNDNTCGDFSEKVGRYTPVLMRAGSANCWAGNPDLVINPGVGQQSAYVSEDDFTNFNGPYTAGGGGMGTACTAFRTYTGFPVTASELWAGSTPNSGNNTITAATTSGSTTITFSNPSASGGGLSVADMVTGPGIPAYTYVVSIGGSTTAVNQTSGTAVLSNNATVTTASGSPATLSIYTFNMFYGINASGSTLVRDTFIADGTNARTSYTVFGTHYSAFNTANATLTYAMTLAAGQGIAFNGIDSTLSYGAGGLTYTANGGTPLTIASPSAGTNGIYIASAPSGYGPQLKAVGPATNIPLNIYAQGSSPIQAFSPLIVSGSVTATGLYASSTTSVFLGNSRGNAVQVADAGGAIANILSILPGTTGFGPIVQAIGSDTNIPLNLGSKGSSPVQVLGSLNVTSGATFGASVVMASFTVATAPAGVAGAHAYFSNARKVGEASGAGTGVSAYYSNGAWRRPSDDTQIAA